jgi:hypothetical protein
LEWAAREPPPIAVKAPLCVQATYFRQTDRGGTRLLVHLFNGVNTAANHGLPAADVPLREETIPIHGIEVAFGGPAPQSFHLEPGGRQLQPRTAAGRVVVELPALDVHAILVAELPIAE